jgi:hypothetical protein
MKGQLVSNRMVGLHRVRMRMFTGLLVVVACTLVVMSPGILRPRELLGGVESQLARQDFQSVSDESAAIVASALSGEGRSVSAARYQALGFTPEKDPEEAAEEAAEKSAEEPSQADEGSEEQEPTGTAEKRNSYIKSMGDKFRGIMGDSGPLGSCGESPLWYHGCHGNASLNEVDHDFYGNASRHGWGHDGPTAYPWKLAPLRRRLGYNRMAPAGTGSFYHELHPFNSEYGPDSTEGIYHAPGFDNTYDYKMPSSEDWVASQKAASSNGGLWGLLKSRFPKGKAGHRWMGMSERSALKSSGDQSAWPQKGSWHWHHWGAIPDPQRAHEETFGSLDPESEANLQLTYGRAYSQWAPLQKFGGVNGDRFYPYAVYKTQLNAHPTLSKHGFKYLHSKYYKRAYKDLVHGTALESLDNKGWGVVDKRIPIKKAVNLEAPAWLRKMRTNSGEPIGDALHNFWQGTSGVDAAPGGGGRSDVEKWKEGRGKRDADGWLEDAPHGHLMAFRGRRDDPEDEPSYDQNEFDRGESFVTKARGVQELALQRKRLLAEGHKLGEKLKAIDSRIQEDKQQRLRAQAHAHAGQGGEDEDGYAAAQKAFRKAMALEGSS